MEIIQEITQRLRLGHQDGTIVLNQEGFQLLDPVLWCIPNKISAKLQQQHKTCVSPAYAFLRNCDLSDQGASIIKKTNMNILYTLYFNQNGIKRCTDLSGRVLEEVTSNHNSFNTFGGRLILSQRDLKEIKEKGAGNIVQ